MLTKPVPTPKDWQTIPNHPLSEATEFGAGIDIANLTESMEKKGYDDNEPMILCEHEGVMKLLDGRHRRAASIAAGVVDPPFRLIDPKDALEWAYKKVLRQHLNAGQRAMFAVQMNKFKPGRPKQDEETSNNKAKSSDSGKCHNNYEVSPAARKVVADKAQVSTATIDKASSVEKHGSMRLQRYVRVGKVPLADAEQVARLTIKEQDAILDKLDAGKIKTVSQALPAKSSTKKPKKQKETPALPIGDPGPEFVVCKACKGTGHVPAEEKALPAAGVPIPPEIDSPEFREVWKEWLQDRKDRKKNVTVRAAQKQLKDLIPLAGRASACVAESIKQGWTGIFTERFTNGQSNGRVGSSGRLLAPEGKYADADATGNSETGCT